MTRIFAQAGIGGGAGESVVAAEYCDVSGRHLCTETMLQSGAHSVAATADGKYLFYNLIQGSANAFMRRNLSTNSVTEVFRFNTTAVSRPRVVDGRLYLIVPETDSAGAAKTLKTCDVETLSCLDLYRGGSGFGAYHVAAGQ